MNTILYNAYHDFKYFCTLQMPLDSKYKLLQNL